MRHTLLLTLLLTACLGETGTETRENAAGSGAVDVSVQALTITKAFINSDNGAAIWDNGVDPLMSLRCWVMAKCTGGGLCSNNNYDCHVVPANPSGVKTRCDNLLSSSIVDDWITTNCTSTGCTVRNGNNVVSGSFQYGSGAGVFTSGSMINYGHAECLYSNATNQAQGKPYVHFWQ